jgi:WD40 repeat protein
MTATRRVLVFDLMPSLNQTLLVHRPTSSTSVTWLEPGAEQASLLEADLAILPAAEGSLAVATDEMPLAAQAGRLAASRKPGATHVWDVSMQPARERVRLNVPEVSKLCFAPDGRLWGISQGLEVWSWREGEAQHTVRFDNRLDQLLTGRSTLLCLASGSDFVLLGGRQGELLYLPESSPTPERWRLNTGPIASVALAPLEDLAACGSEDGEVRLVAVPSGSVLQELADHDDSVGGLHFSADGGILASASLDRSVRLWHQTVGDWEELLTLRFPAPVLDVRFHPRQPTLAIQVQGELAVRILPLEDLRARLAERRLGW